jgi:hypothetical protein
VQIFGGRAMGNFNFGGKIDLDVVKPAEPRIMGAFVGNFSDSYLTYFVNLVNINNLSNIEFVEHIKRNEKLILSPKPFVNP